MTNIFLLWHYSKGLTSFIKAWKNFFAFFWYYFGVKIHFFTLFKNWKRDLSRVNQPGFHPLLLLRSLVENILTRFLGLIVRSFVIGLALLFEIVTFVFGLLFLIFWLFWPLLIIASVLFLFSAPDTFQQPSAIYLTIIASFLVFIFSLICFISREKDYAKMSFQELSREKWFERVWNRIGKEDVKMTETLASNINNLKEYLDQLEISIKEFSQIIIWEINEYLRKRRQRIFWLRENLFSVLPIGRSWPFAYTNHLDRYSNDLSEEDFSQYKYAQLIGKNKSLEELKLILTRPNQNSVLIIGEPGMGRKTLVHSLAREVRNNCAGKALANQRILELDLKALIATSEMNAEKTIHLIFSEATQAGNIILVINNLHEYLEKERANWNFSSILSDYLAYPNFQLIGTTTSEDFHRTIEKYSNLTKNCEKIKLEEASPEETLKVMLYKLERLEEKNIIFTYQALREIITLAEQYINDSPFPEKALDLMEETILYWSQNRKTNFIDKATVDKVVSLKINVPLGEIGDQESQKLLNLESFLHKRVVGQNFAVEGIAEIVRKTRAGMANRKKPLGSFLFLGPTGVGKTESAKALAEAYFGDEERMIRLDMSEYQNANSIDRIIGSNATGEKGHLTTQVKNNPHSLLLLDEIEKAHPNILDLFLQVLDEGIITNAFGKKVSFRNLIIIATSNAGSIKIQECIQNKISPDKTQEILTNHLIEKGLFKAEFLNRFDGLVYFHPLTSEETTKITSLLLEKYAKRLKKNENIDVTFSPELPSVIAEKAYDEKFGARAISRYIENEVGSKIVEDIIAKKIKKGTDIVFDTSRLE